MIPGMNLLNIATSVIGTESVKWLAFSARTKNDLGQWVSSYSPAVTITGSWQAVPRDRYQNLGLDESKSYFNLFTSNNIRGAETGRASDIIQKNSRKYEVKSVTPWAGIDGWNEVLCVDVGAVDE